ncbi:phenylalanine--tRNA ligase subunit beta [filamentous cyanobacterium LEGE 11480]|uniref:Phenylalanine--tRNA ligase beta subunit n=1 Tax=Romeriopsis navalis LEGE 11480 TaxID=2777977 RepID=A0A928VJ95_9CYAN|nr:phenylalanine--tRNA ligase subunit beta [Romeriopsis navalis]MBE9028763.1 phenylalanine--tRNA ligase subunit beta [Romeriopsis navalis LEGE 11480]
MRISLNWLRELVETDLSPENLADILTMAGFEVEDIEDRKSWAKGVVIGRVMQREKHPDADKLSVCQIDIGSGELQQIVCGAANIAADIFVPIATVGSFLPKAGDGLKIKPAKLRGVASNGMVCSIAELGLAKDSDGIHIFDETAFPKLKAGDDARPYMGLDDVVLDLSSTANRADALSMVGIAREVAALTGAKLKLPVAADNIAASGSGLSLSVSDVQACATYIGSVIEGIKIGTSPAWLQDRLQASGVRPINNVVDVTYYIMLEWGQPLHAFDRDRLQTVTGTSDLDIGVRFAQKGEKLTTLDSQERTGTEQTLFITAANKPVALAGLMGGEATEVHDGSENLMLEAALFDTAAVRKSARSQGLRTEASLRYERGVNLAELEVATNRAIQLITELAGGTVVGQAIADHRPDTLTRTIALRFDRTTEILGQIVKDAEIVDLEPRDVEQTLTRLNCQLEKTDQANVWNVVVPPYRYRDLEREIDLIEEVARVYGYNNFNDTLPPVHSEAGYLSTEQAITRSLREAFRGVGLTELIHYSLGKPGKPNQVELSNPLLAEYAALRTDLLDGLIEAFQYNLEQGNGSLNGFEIGHTFCTGEVGFEENECLAGIIGGDPSCEKWQRGGKDQPLSWFEAKGLLDSVFSRLSLAVEYQPDQQETERLHPGRTASLWLRGKRLGTFGQLHPQLRQERSLPDEVYVFELDLQSLMQALSSKSAMVPTLKAYSTFPASDRDIAFYIQDSVTVAELQRAMRKAGGKLLQSITLFDEYKGDNVPDGQRSLAFRLVYRTNNRTLKDEDVEPAMQKVRDTLVSKFKADLRS